MSYSYATERKIRIIEVKLGPNWKSNNPDLSIDAIYNELTGDTRKNLFCKIKSEVKDHLDIMTKVHKTGMAEFIEQLIDAEYSRFIQRQQQDEMTLREEFSG